ncbi:MAG: GIY-YIG nuclease family protein [Clostridia bacterium]|nr:GIY-YIG nuclease family protein [Clostridia bacterium]
MNTATYWVYILTNTTNTVLYTGVTNDLARRLWEHKNDLVEGFTQRYRVHKLVYFEETTDVHAALEREKQIKRWRRQKKEALIGTMNADWENLSSGWFELEEPQE